MRRDDDAVLSLISCSACYMYYSMQLVVCLLQSITSSYYAVQQHKRLSGPWFGALEADIPMCIIFRRSVFVHRHQYYPLDNTTNIHTYIYIYIYIYVYLYLYLYIYVLVCVTPDPSISGPLKASGYRRSHGGMSEEKPLGGNREGRTSLCNQWIRNPRPQLEPQMTNFDKYDVS